jgi:glycerol-3-phosphate acyltransferase PlsY
MIFVAKYAAVIIIGYLVGSVPFGVLVSRLTTGADPRLVGSGKIGTTNVLRTAGKKAAALVLILDLTKGALPVILAELIFEGNHVVWYGEGLLWTTRVAQVTAAVSAIAGHNWSVFLKFKGGRGVATFIGGLLAMYWPAAIVGGGVVLIIGVMTRYMSLGSISGAVTAFIMLASLIAIRPEQFSYVLAYVFYTMICAVFIFAIHRDNIMRLVTGTERRLGDKPGARQPPLGNNK